jgi:hypothetical protein
MKASETRRAAMLVVARDEWKSVITACKKRGTDRGLEFLVGSLHIDNDHTYVDDHDASVPIDCKTGLLVAEAALKIINAELKKLGVS